MPPANRALQDTLAEANFDDWESVRSVASNCLSPARLRRSSSRRFDAYPTRQSAVLKVAKHRHFQNGLNLIHRTDPTAQRLLAHILETKRLYWTLISSLCGIAGPPEALEAVMRYELEMTGRLGAAQLARSLEYSGRTMTVEQLIRLSARHSVWHAGQIAATR